VGHNLPEVVEDAFQAIADQGQGTDNDRSVEKIREEGASRALLEEADRQVEGEDEGDRTECSVDRGIVEDVVVDFVVEGVEPFVDACGPSQMREADPLGFRDSFASEAGLSWVDSGMLAVGCLPWVVLDARVVERIRSWIRFELDGLAWVGAEVVAMAGIYQRTI
jgi:hypothetical protein